MGKRRRPLAPDPLRRYVSFRTLQPRGQWGAVRKSLQELIGSASPAALREAVEYLQLQYRKLHESEAYLAPGEWERRSRLVTIKVTDFEFEALSRLAEVTGLTKSWRESIPQYLKGLDKLGIHWHAEPVVNAFLD